MGKEVHRKIFLESLPKKEGRGKLKGSQVVDWANCCGSKVRVLYDDIDVFVEIINCTPKTNLLTIRNDIYGDFEILSGNFLKCKLGKYFNKFTNEFRLEIGQEIKDDRRNLIIIDRKIVKDKKGQGYKYYKYKCNNCGFSCGEHYKSGEYRDELWIEEANLLTAGNGCSCCCVPNQIVVEGINDIPTTTPWMIKYFQGGYNESKRYLRNSMALINPICPDCKSVKKKKMKIGTIYIEKSIGCKICGDGVSYPSKFVKSILEQIGVDYEQEVKFDWCSYYNKYSNKDTYGLYDFVLESKKIIIEVDGEFHRKHNHLNGKTKEESEYIDNIKDVLAKEKGYKVIRISDEGNLKENTLNSKLKDIFDLSKIDWLKCEEFALSNLVKQVCEYWNNKTESETTSDLGIKFHLCRKTIIDYLKKGMSLGWTNYNPKEETKKAARRMAKILGKNVEIFKNGETLGVFESTKDLERQSEGLFNIKLGYRGIADACNGKLKTYKGFTFKYVS